MTIQERIFAQLSKNSKKRVSLDLFGDYRNKLEEAKNNFYIASGEMESFAIELELKEKEMLDYRAEYFNTLGDYVLEVEEKLRELGLDSFPDNWSREFDRLRNDIPEVESIKGIVDTVKTQFR